MKFQIALSLAESDSSVPASTLIPGPEESGTDVSADSGEASKLGMASIPIEIDSAVAPPDLNAAGAAFTVLASKLA
jgi:hypothetical protein